MSGVPFPARNKNGVDKTTRIDARRDTLLLNQRFNRRIKRSPSAKPTMILGNLIAYGVKPNSIMETFWRARYGKSTMSPLNGASNSSEYEFVAEFISASESPVCANSGKRKSKKIKAAPSKI